VFVNKQVQDVIVVILFVCYIDHCCATIFQSQTHLVFRQKEKGKKTGEKGRKGRIEGRLCQNTPKTNAKKGKGVTTLQS